MAIADAGIGIRTVNHWIGGRSIASTSGRSGIVWNPATGEEQATIGFASAEEVDQAVAAPKLPSPNGAPRRSPAVPK